MLNVSEATKNAYKADSVQKQFTISFPNANITYRNDDIVIESFELIESIEANENISFMGCVASQMKFICAAPVRDLRGEKVNVSIVAGDTEPITLFNGYIDEQTNITQEDVVTEFVAYDKLYTVGQRDVTAWYNGLTFPITIKNFRNSFFTYIGITQATQTLICDNLSIAKIDTKDQILAIDVMKSICQANASFGRIGRDEKFYYTQLNEITEGLYPSTETYPSNHTFPSRENAGAVFDKSNYIKISYEPFKTNLINAVYLISSDGSKTVAGSGTNVLAITDNIVAQGCTNKASMVNAIYNKVKSLYYTPCNIDAKGYPWIECGDIFTVNTRRNMVRAYVLTRRLKGIQALYDNFSADGTQTRELYKETEKTQSTTREADIQGNTADIQVNTANIGTLRTDLIQTNNLVATKANITDLNATNARVGTLETDVANINTLVAQKANITDLNAVSARVGTLEADHVSVSQLNATNANVSNLSGTVATFQQATVDAFTATNARVTNLEADHVSASEVTADVVRTKMLSACAVSPFQGTMDMGTIRTASLQLYQNGYHGLTLGTITVAGTSYNVVKWS